MRKRFYPSAATCRLETLSRPARRVVAEGVDHSAGGDAAPDAGSGVEPFDQVAHLVGGQAPSSGVDQ